jgi:formylglycine-generating enzyme required for sulfatase activity
MFGEDQFGLWKTLKYAGVKQKFRWCEPGYFTTENDPKNNQPTSETPKRVKILKGFWCADTCVTQELWYAMMETDSSKYKGKKRPADNIFFDDAEHFIAKYNSYFPGVEAALPTEKQWEYACRSGTNTKFSFGDEITLDLVNYDANISVDSVMPNSAQRKNGSVPVKSLPPNHWGLYEMHGNVWEWCHDYHAQQNLGLLQVVRGGSWFNDADSCRSASRVINVQKNDSGVTGFRIILGHA